MNLRSLFFFLCLGLAGASRVMASILRNVIGSMNRGTLLSVCGYIRHLML